MLCPSTVSSHWSGLVLLQAAHAVQQSEALVHVAANIFAVLLR